MLLVMRVLSIVPLNFKVTPSVYTLTSDMGAYIFDMSRLVVRISFLIGKISFVTTYRAQSGSTMVSATVTRTARVQLFCAVPHAGTANTP